MYPNLLTYILASEIAPPYNLEFTRDLNVCLGRLRRNPCPANRETVCNFMNNGYTTLIWDWIPGCWFEPCPFNVEDIDGYHVYRDSPGMDPVLVQSIINPKIHIAMIPPESSGGGIIPPKFFVRAYKGSDESMDSPHIQGLSPKYTVILKDPWLKSDTVSAEQGEGGAEIDYYYPETELTVGYDFGKWEDIGTHYAQQIFRCPGTFQNVGDHKTGDACRAALEDAGRGGIRYGYGSIFPGMRSFAR